MRDENLTEQEFYDKYGTEVVTNNEYSAVDLAQSLTEIRESVYIEDESTILKYYGVLSVYADQ